jgi:predicted solute-binding protein
MLEFHALAEGIVKRIDEEYENHLEKMGLGREIDTFIKENINSITYSLSEHQEDAVNELYQMVYFYGILEDLFDIKFIE